MTNVILTGGTPEMPTLTLPEPGVGNSNWSVLFVGDIDNPSGYGTADGVMRLHIAARDGEVANAEIVPGNYPFSVQLEINGSLVRTITGILPCEDFANFNQDPSKGPVCDYNCVITGLPAGQYDIIIEDNLLPPNDARGLSMFNMVQPPSVTLNGQVHWNNLPTMVTFEFGTTTAYGRVAEFGMVTEGPMKDCSIDLRSKIDGSNDPVEYLEPGTLYHYRIVAENALGVSYGEDKTFVTHTYGSAPIAITLGVTNLT